MKENNQTKLSVSQIGKFLAERNFEEKCIAGLEDCLSATVTVCGGDGKLCTYPDSKTRLSAITLGLAYTAGKPVERREIMTRTMTTLETLREQTKASPEMRRALMKLLDEKPVIGKSDNAST